MREIGTLEQARTIKLGNKMRATNRLKDNSPNNSALGVKAETHWVRLTHLERSRCEYLICIEDTANTQYGADGLASC